MKNLICVSIITFFAFQTTAYSQSAHPSADRITILLCKKWEIDYILMEGKKVKMPSTTSNAYIEFYKDRTFSVIGGEVDSTKRGLWKYNASKGTIAISMDGKDHQQIKLLTPNQFVAFSDDPTPDPFNPSKGAMKTLVYFKVKKG